MVRKKKIQVPTRAEEETSPEEEAIIGAAQQQPQGQPGPQDIASVLAGLAGGPPQQGVPGG